MELKIKEGFEKCPSSHYTPEDIIDTIFKDITFRENDCVLEPCAGIEFRMYNKIPINNKFWCEIDFGVDLFNSFDDKRFTKIITNPPYKSNHIDKEDREIEIKRIEKEKKEDSFGVLQNVNPIASKENESLNSLSSTIKKNEWVNFGKIKIELENGQVWKQVDSTPYRGPKAVSYTHLRAHET